jgi:hypothetical protein
VQSVYVNIKDVESSGFTFAPLVGSPTTASYTDASAARQSKRRPDRRAATNKLQIVKIALALLSRRDNHQSAATVNMAFPIAANFSSRLSRYTA